MSSENGQLPEDDKPKEEKIPKEEIDEDAPLVDSSEEEDSDEENEYEEDGFVVADNEDEDLPDVGSDQEREKRKSRLKRLRKGGKRKVRHLDDEDLELIAEHQGLAPSSKLRKTVADSEDPEAPSSISVAKAASVPRAERSETTTDHKDDFEMEDEANSEDDDFLVSDDEDENEDAAVRKQRKKEKRERRNVLVNYEQYQDAALIYDDGWLNEMYDPSGEGIFDDSEWGPLATLDADKFAALRKQYDPETLKEMYLTERDEQIRMADIPERHQLAFPKRETPGDEALSAEASWICSKLFSADSMASTDASIQQKVTQILTLLLSSHYEMAFIEHYRREFWSPQLVAADLWRIVDLDHQWYTIQVRKDSLRKALPDADTISKDPRLADFETKIKIAQSEDAVQDLAEFYTYYYSSNNTPSNTTTAPLEDVVDDEVEAQPSTNAAPKKPVQKRPVRADLKTLAREAKLDAFYIHIGVKPRELATTMAFGTPSTINMTSFSTLPLTVAEDFVAPPFFSTAGSVLQGAASLYASELAVDPNFRQCVAEHFDLHAVLSTKATPQGKLYIDLFHPYANVRHLKGKPLLSFKGSSLFLQIVKAVEEGLIEVAISLPPEKTALLIRELGASFRLESLGDYEHDKESPEYLWASLRRSILEEAVNQTIPKLITRTKAKLNREATQVVLSETEQALEKLLREGGIRVPAARTMRRIVPGSSKKRHAMEEEYTAVPPIVSICVADPTQSREVMAMAAIIDEHGEIKDTLPLLASLRIEDSIALKDFFRKHSPFVVAVGIDTPLAKTFHSKIAELVNTYVAEENVEPIKVVAMPLDVAIIFQSTRHAEKEFNTSSFHTPSPEAGMLLRRATSAARRLLDPLLEISGLFSQYDYILGLDLHPLRKLVPQAALKRHLENAFVRVVSDVGIDLNRIVQHTWMQPVLQFVSGLGPRKASALLEGLVRGGEPVESRHQLKDSAENSQLRPGEYLGPVVWDNAIAFLRVIGNDSVELRDWNPLDGTRIHPVAYVIAKKIGDDLMLTGHIKQDADFVEAISKDPSLLRNVDIGQMIETLRSKQVHKELTVRALVEELKAPFADSRIFNETPMSHIFDLVVGKGALDVGMVVTVRVGPQDRTTLSYSVDLPNFIRGTISAIDAPSERLARNSSIQAQVLGVDKELFTVQLTCTLSSSSWDAYSVPNRDAWLAPEDIDLNELLPGAKDASKPSIVTRSLVHRNYVNKSQQEVEETLAAKQIGAYLIHPTTKKNYLTITSKWWFDKFAHISIEETETGSFKIDKETYENLDDLVVRFMDPMLMNVKDLQKHTCFDTKNKPDMMAAIQAEKAAKPNRSPYHIAPSSDKPGFFVLYYIPGSSTVHKEYVHVVPDGFKYRSIVHVSVDKLLSYFKKHFNDPAYLQQQKRERQEMRQQQQPAALPAYQTNMNWQSSYPSQYPPLMPTTNMNYGLHTQRI